MSRINNEAWDKLKTQINFYLKEDSNLTDIQVNYQVRESTRNTKNILNLAVKIQE